MNATSVEAARAAVETFFTAFNARDEAGVKAAMHFPHVRIASGAVRITSADDFRMPFDRLAEIEGWDHSTLDRCELVHDGPDKVHFDVGFSRYHADGERYAQHRSLWVMTSIDGRWAVLARSSYAP